MQQLKDMFVFTSSRWNSCRHFVYFDGPEPSPHQTVDISIFIFVINQPDWESLITFILILYTVGVGIQGEGKLILGSRQTPGDVRPGGWIMLLQKLVIVRNVWIECLENCSQSVKVGLVCDRAPQMKPVEIANLIVPSHLLNHSLWSVTPGCMQVGWCCCAIIDAMEK